MDADRIGIIKRFFDLVAWQEAKKLVVSLYEETKSFPASEQFGLTNQIRRAAVSISANIAEAFRERPQKTKGISTKQHLLRFLN